MLLLRRQRDYQLHSGECQYPCVRAVVLTMIYDGDPHRNALNMRRVVECSLGIIVFGAGAAWFAMRADLSLPPGTSESRPESENESSSGPVTLVVSGDTAGWILPCGCTSNQSGGLARRGTFIAQL